LRRERAERSAKAYEKAFGTTDYVTEFETDNYVPEESLNVIKVKAGKFTESVRSEYEFYVGYTRLKNVAKKQSKIENVSGRSENAKTRDIQSTAFSEKIKSDDSRYADFAEDKFAKSRDKLDSISKRLDHKDEKNPDKLEYRTEEDAVKIKKILQDKNKKESFRWNLSIGLTFAMFLLCCLSGLFTVGKGDEAENTKMRVFAFINFAIYGAMIYNCRDIIISGLRPIRKFKSNPDTGFAAAAVVTALQSVFALITPTPFLRQGLNIYTLIVTFALALNCLGRQRNADRISSNFRFVSDSSQKYTGKFFHDQRMVATLLSGTKNDKSELVFQKKTSFLKHFIKLSNSPDPGEDLADKFSLPSIIFSLVISIIYLCLSKSLTDTMSVLSIMLCAAVPMCSKALGAVQVHRLSKNSLANQSMVVGYQAVDSFSESAAVMLDAKELYPEGSVHMNGIKKFDPRRIDDAILAAASVIITAGGAMAGMFDGIIHGDKQENLPTAENVIYEDGKGLIGWVNNERIFIGNRELLKAHDIEPMSKEYEEKQKEDGDEILYLACAGELVAMFIVGYSANRRVADALRRMEANGMSMLIRTTDVNITAERIAKDFGISHRSIKILEQKNSN
ncbi:MAG: cation-translocating P-type ATPase, partial [Clostridia bacterium]|nr:cation-translocating P-type ATPase [Clostridia bacterium]